MIVLTCMYVVLMFLVFVQKLCVYDFLVLVYVVLVCVYVFLVFVYMCSRV